MMDTTNNQSLDPLLIPDAGHREFLLGNDAIIRGALEAGVGFASGYPGTPSSEITDGFARLSKTCGIDFEYSVNEKIAIEMAFAASLAGTRSIVAMKHLGLMYGGDPLTTIPYIGTVGGMVIVSAGDPSCLTSPNEQDQRQVAQMLHIPMFDPGTPQEALELTRYAFELSERVQLPVILRPMTRVCHVRAEVTYGALKEQVRSGFVRDPGRFVPIPANARRLRVEVDNRLDIARAMLIESGVLRRRGTGRTMIVAVGVPAATTTDLLRSMGLEEQVSLMSLGATWPLPEDWLVEQLRGADRVLVVEELLPFIEDALLAITALHKIDVEILGKRSGHLPSRFEYMPATIQSGIHAALGLGNPPIEGPEPEELPIRPPVLCASCPHRSAFFAARAAFDDDVLYFNDIGCYTLGFGPPLQTADALLCMGAGFTLAAGVSKTSGERTVGFMGDSTFFHSGMPALLNAIKEDANIVAVVMDNEVTAMTGFQESPSIEIERGRIERRVDIAGVVRALGCEHVEVVDPDDLAATTAAFRRAKEASGVSTIITSRPCTVFYRRLCGEQPAKAVEDSPEQPGAKIYQIDHARCQNCGRGSCGQRCSQSTQPSFERAMTRARSAETGENKKETPEIAPCAEACPLELCVQGYSAHIASGNYAGALELIMERLPLPDSVCRVCHKPCEKSCVRLRIDDAVGINDLKRFVMDWAGEQDEFPYSPPVEDEHGRKIAVVGAGPAGLAAAHDLRLRGYGVTVFDAGDEPGGLLLTGIPRYRLPLKSLRADVARIEALGVRFESKRRLGEDFQLSGLLDDFDAVCLATGAGIAAQLGLSGDGPIVSDALGYLARSRTGDRRPEDRRPEDSRPEDRRPEDSRPGDSRPGDSGTQSETQRRVLVIGGGNSAIDSARTAMRLGAERVVIVCLERLDEMPAIRGEITEAEREGIEILPRTKVLSLQSDGAVLAKVAPRIEGSLDPADFEVVGSAAGGSAVVGSDVGVFEADQVIVAIGQRPDRDALEAAGVQDCWKDRVVAADPRTGATSLPRVFAAGDLVPGDLSVTGAIAQGMRAAWGIDSSLRGDEVASQRMPPPEVTGEAPAGRPGVILRDAKGRCFPPELDHSARKDNFDEVAGVFSEAQARAEAERCMICGQCGNCRACLDLFGCPAFFVDDSNRIQIDEQLCVGCGVCAQFCPNGAIRPADETGGEEA